MLKFNNVSKYFNNKAVLNNINLELTKGSISLFIGSSGVGKSTLLRILCGLENPDSGSITIENLPLKNQNLSIGMVFQHFNLFSHMNVLTNITFPLEKILGYSKKTAALIGLELLQKYNLLDCASLSIKSLSGGQKQRLAIARTLAIKPSLICFDEPTSALDPSLTLQVVKNITELAHEGYTIMIASHDTLLVEKLSCTLYLMEHGAIIESAHSSSILEHPNLYPAIHKFITGE